MNTIQMGGPTKQAKCKECGVMVSTAGYTRMDHLIKNHESRIRHLRHIYPMAIDWFETYFFEEPTR